MKLYNLLKISYSKKNKKHLYNKLLITNELNNYLFSVGNEAQEKIEFLTNCYVKNDKNLTEKLKESNQLESVSQMNNYKNMAEEIVLKELIYD